MIPSCNILATFGINGSLRRREVQAQAPYTEHYLFNSAVNMKAYSYDKTDFAYYGYNASNTRTYKLSMLNQNQWVNGQPQPLNLHLQNAMFYPNAYINFNQNGEYTKHYYNGSERICSRLGNATLNIAATANSRLSVRSTQADNRFQADVQELMDENIPQNPAGQSAGFTSVTITSLQPANATTDIFYYHMNHLGSTAYVTDQNQTITQGFLYAPFGEITTEFNANFGSDVLPKYSFNAKELDEETGMYYYEARYYKPPVFTSRDPMFEKYFWMSPYAYCANNPVKYVDPNGEEIGDFYDRKGNYLGNDGEQDGKKYLLKEGYRAKTENTNVNWGGTLEKKHADQLKNKSDEVGALIIMNRIEEGDDYTISQYTTTGDAEGYFLEPAGPSTTEANQDKRIPEGVYDIDSYSSTNFPDNFILSNKKVSKDRKILIHTGNTGNDTEGCLLPGNKKGQGSVRESKKNMSTLRSFIKNHNNKPIKLIINSSI